MCGGTSTNTVTQKTQQPQWVQNAIQGQLQNALGTQGNFQYPNYTGELVPANNAVQGQAGAGFAGLSGFNPSTVTPGSVSAGDVSSFTQGMGAGPGGLSLDQNTIAGYQNPYTRQVADVTMDELNRQLQRTNQNAAGQAALGGAFGGDRAQIVQSENARNTNQIAAQALANLNQQGFNTASGLASQDLNRGLTAGTTNAAMGLQAGTANLNAGLQAQQGNQFAGLQGANLRMAANNGLMGYGNALQATQQTADRTAYDQFMNRAYFPLTMAQAGTNTVQQLGGVMTSTPTTSTTSPGPSTLGQIAGLGVAGLGLYGALNNTPTSSARGGLAGYAHGGDVDGYATGGSTVNPMQTAQGILGLYSLGKAAGNVPGWIDGLTRSIQHMLGSDLGANKAADMATNKVAAAVPKSVATDTPGIPSSVAEKVGDTAAVDGVAAPGAVTDAGVGSGATAAPTGLGGTAAADTGAVAMGAEAPAAALATAAPPAIDAVGTGLAAGAEGLAGAGTLGTTLAAAAPAAEAGAELAALTPLLLAARGGRIGGYADGGDTGDVPVDMPDSDLNAYYLRAHQDELPRALTLGSAAAASPYSADQVDREIQRRSVYRNNLPPAQARRAIAGDLSGIPADPGTRPALAFNDNGPGDMMMPSQPVGLAGNVPPATTISAPPNTDLDQSGNSASELIPDRSGVPGNANAGNDEYASEQRHSNPMMAAPVVGLAGNGSRGQPMPTPPIPPQNISTNTNAGGTDQNGHPHDFIDTMFRGKNSWALPVLAAGLGMMASRNPRALGAIGEGGLAGTKMLETMANQRATNDIRRMQMESNDMYRRGMLGIRGDANTIRGQQVANTGNYQQGRNELGQQRVGIAQQNADTNASRAQAMQEHQQAIQAIQSRLADLKQRGLDQSQQATQLRADLQIAIKNASLAQGADVSNNAATSRENFGRITMGQRPVARSGVQPQTVQMPDRGAQSGANTVPSANDVAYLRQNPGLRAQFDRRFGAGASDAALAQTSAP